MPGFLYYLPDLPYATSKADVAARLPHALDPERVLKVQVMGGPDNGHGLVVCDPNRVPPDRCGYYPIPQTWKRAPGGRWWCGWYEAEPPTPEDLARSPQLRGHAVKLCDGRRWLAPIALGASEHEGQIIPRRALPGAASLDNEGHWSVGQVQAKYRALWEIATRFAAAFFGAEQTAGGVAFDYAEQQQHAVECLAANYAIGPVEVAALGLFDDQLYAAQAILQALIDWPVYEAWLKKKATAEASSSIPAGSHSGAGSAV